MIIDVTGTVPTPGNGGRECLGNGRFVGYECCCDECDYFLCCYKNEDSILCKTCRDTNCPFICKAASQTRLTKET